MKSGSVVSDRLSLPRPWTPRLRLLLSILSLIVVAKSSNSMLLVTTAALVLLRGSIEDTTNNRGKRPEKTKKIHQMTIGRVQRKLCFQWRNEQMTVQIIQTVSTPTPLLLFWLLPEAYQYVVRNEYYKDMSWLIPPRPGHVMTQQDQNRSVSTFELRSRIVFWLDSLPPYVLVALDPVTFWCKPWRHTLRSLSVIISITSCESKSTSLHWIS
jgi:hypothetical protein